MELWTKSSCLPISDISGEVLVYSCQFYCVWCPVPLGVDMREFHQNLPSHYSTMMIGLAVSAQYHCMAEGQRERILI